MSTVIAWSSLLHTESRAGTDAGRAGARRVLAATGLTLGLLAAPAPAWAAASNTGLDPSFGDGGRVVTDIAGIGNHDFIAALAVQPDGKIVAAGTAGEPDSIGVTDFGLVRYLPDGSLDPSFGDGGVVTTNVFGSDSVHAMVRYADGRLLVVGRAVGGERDDFALARYRPDGSLDTGFGRGGIVTTDFEYVDEARAVALRPDGRIVVAGEANDYLNDPFVVGFALAQYLPNGSLDPSFGEGGRVFVPTSGDGGAEAMVIERGGKILACGGGTLVRFLPNGSLDRGFADGGVATVDFKGDRSYTSALVTQGAHIYVAGTVRSDDNGPDFAVARYHSDGRPDLGFGEYGSVRTDVGDADYAEAFAMVVDRAGTLVVAGRAAGGPNGFDFALVRYHRDGALDLRFGANGQLITDIAGNADQVNAVAWQADGRLLAGGEAYPLEPGYFADFALVRYRLR